MFEKHLCKSNILSKDAGRYLSIFTLNVALSQVFYKHFASKTQLPGFHISGLINWNLKRNNVFDVSEPGASIFWVFLDVISLQLFT